MVTVLQAPMSPSQAALAGAASGLQQGFQRQALGQLAQQSQGLSPQEQSMLIMQSNLPQTIKQELIGNLQFQQQVDLRKQQVDMQAQRLNMELEAFQLMKDEKARSRKAYEAFNKRIKELYITKSNEAAQVPPEQAGLVNQEKLDRLGQLAQASDAFAKQGLPPDTLRSLQLEIVSDPDLSPQDKKELNGLMNMMQPQPMTQGQGISFYNALRAQGVDPDIAASELVKQGISLNDAEKIMKIRGDTLSEDGTKYARFNKFNKKIDDDLQSKFKKFFPPNPLTGEFDFTGETAIPNLISYAKQYKLAKKSIYKRAAKDGFISELQDDYLAGEGQFLRDFLLNNGVSPEAVDIVMMQSYGPVKAAQGKPEQQAAQESQSNIDALNELLPEREELRGVVNELPPGYRDVLENNPQTTEALKAFQESDVKEQEFQASLDPLRKDKTVLEKSISDLKSEIDRRKSQGLEVPIEARNNLRKLEKRLNDIDSQLRGAQSHRQFMRRLLDPESNMLRAL